MKQVCSLGIYGELTYYLRGPAGVTYKVHVFICGGYERQHPLYTEKSLPAVRLGWLAAARQIISGSINFKYTWNKNFFSAGILLYIPVANLAKID